MSDTAVLDRLDQIDSKIDALIDQMGGCYISVCELARKTGYSQSAIHTFIKNGTIPVQHTQNFGERGRMTTVDLGTAFRFMQRPQTKAQIARAQREANNAEH